MAYIYAKPDSFCIDYALHNYLTQNFHPIVARVQFLKYVFQDNHMTGKVKSVYIQDRMIMEEAESTQSDWVSRRHKDPMAAWNRLIGIVTDLFMPVAEIYTYLRDMTRFVIYHQDRWTETDKLGIDAKIKDFHDLIDEVFENVHIRPTDRYVQDHAAVIYSLLGPGSKILTDLAGFCNAVSYQSKQNSFYRDFPDTVHKFEFDHFTNDPFESRHVTISRSIDDLREKFIDWPRNNSQSGFIDLHFAVFLYDIDKCFTEPLQWSNLTNCKQPEQLRLRMTQAFANANVDSIINGQMGQDYRCVDREIFDWMNNLTKRRVLPANPNPGWSTYRKKRARDEDDPNKEYIEVSKIQKPLKIPRIKAPVVADEEPPNEWPQDTEDDIASADSRNRKTGIVTAVVALGLLAAAYATYRKLY